MKFVQENSNAMPKLFLEWFQILLVPVCKIIRILCVRTQCDNQFVLKVLYVLSNFYLLGAFQMELIKIAVFDVRIVFYWALALFSCGVKIFFAIF